MKEELIIRIANRVNSTIIPLCQPYEINFGGCGMFAVLLCRQIRKYCLQVKIRAYHTKERNNFYGAEHYSVVFYNYEFNSFKQPFQNTQDVNFEEVNEEDLYWLKNACEGYNHRNDIEIKEIISKNI
ncbi:MAG: hypothetical protein KBT34_03030 [Prevotella sp.]|nr:hypothetical protein [Candidatus Prevotella equi]